MQAEAEQRAKPELRTYEPPPGLVAAAAAASNNKLQAVQKVKEEELGSELLRFKVLEQISTEKKPVTGIPPFVFDPIVLAKELSLTVEVKRKYQ